MDRKHVWSVIVNALACLHLIKSKQLFIFYHTPTLFSRQILLTEWPDIQLFARCHWRRIALYSITVWYLAGIPDITWFAPRSSVCYLTGKADINTVCVMLILHGRQYCKQGKWCRFLFKIKLLKLKYNFGSKAEEIRLGFDGGKVAWKCKIFASPAVIFSGYALHVTCSSACVKMGMSILYTFACQRRMHNEQEGGPWLAVSKTAMECDKCDINSPAVYHHTSRAYRLSNCGNIRLVRLISYM